MNFSKLRHRIIFLSPTDEIINSMGETVPKYRPFKPYLPLPLQVDADKVYLSHDNDGNAVLEYANGKHMHINWRLKTFLLPHLSHRPQAESMKKVRKSEPKPHIKSQPDISETLHRLCVFSTITVNLRSCPCLT